MKKVIFLVSIVAASSVFAAGKNCDSVAKKAAQDYMGEQMDEACSKSKAKVAGKSVSAGKIKYQIDVQCGPDVPDNHYQQNVEVDANSCNVLSGGPGEA